MHTDEHTGTSIYTHKSAHIHKQTLKTNRFIIDAGYQVFLRNN